MKTIAGQDIFHDRPVILAKYLIENKSTVRDTAKHFGISKSTVHKDLTDKLKNLDIILYYKVKEILDINKQERHIRGGEATKIKYEKLKTKI